MRIHFIAIGGSVMHNLAMALKQKGDQVSGSDDEIFEPARSNLALMGILPENEGWYPDKIHAGLDAVILGMHAKSDNPELLKARELGLKIFSFPGFLFEHAKNKRRIVIGGSHGKTTITGMIMHVLKDVGLDFDYMVGAKLDGFDIMVRLSEEAPLMIFEGDEYLTSALDPRPKFHLYQPHIALLSGIDWDHMNVFPTPQIYHEQFLKFTNQVQHGGVLVYCSDDEAVVDIAHRARPDVLTMPYTWPVFQIVDKKTIIFYNKTPYMVQVFGRHNMHNLEGARIVCAQLGITADQFYKSITTYRGASKRLERIAESNDTAIYKDFAHAPSKLKASIQAVKEQYEGRELVACMELHTYSSLNKDFLPQYTGAMDMADTAIVFYNPHAFKIKKLPIIDQEDICRGFQREDLIIFNQKKELEACLVSRQWKDKNLLLMSSGDFGGINLQTLANQLIQ